MRLEPIYPHPGSATDTNDFVGRVEVTARVQRHLDGGINLLLNDPRRMGKSFWLRYLTQNVEGYTPFLIDYEGVNTREGFLIRTGEVLNQHSEIQQKLRAWFESVELSVFGLTLKVSQQEQPKQRLLQNIFASTSEIIQPPLILMDELPVAVLDIAKNEGAEAAKETLQTLRYLRRSIPNIRWILCGSIGFHHVLAECGIHTTEGVTNDLVAFYLGALESVGEQKELAERLLLGTDLDYEYSSINALAELTGAIPYLMQVVALKLGNIENPVVITPKLVSCCFEDFIDEPEAFGSFIHFLTRLDGYYGDDADLAGQILDELLFRTNTWVDVVVLQGKYPDNHTPTVIDKLVKDHYLVQRGSRVRWRYPVLQYIWARRRNIWDRP